MGNWSLEHRECRFATSKLDENQRQARDGSLRMLAMAQKTRRLHCDRSPLVMEL